MKRSGKRFFIGPFLIGLCAAFLLGGCGDSAKEDSGSYDQAISALESGDYEAAMEGFRNAAKLDGRGAEACRGEGIVCYEQGNYKYAVQLFDLSLEKMEKDNTAFKEDVLYYKAEALVKNEQTDEAEAVYDELAKGSNPARAYARKGCLLLRNGGTGEAETCFSQALENGIGIEECLLIYRTYAALNREAEGAVYLEKAVEIQPEDANEQESLGEVYSCLQDSENAAVCFRKAMEEGNTRAVDALAEVYLQADNLSAAKELYMQLLEDEENTARAYNGLALCALAEGNYESALTYVSRGLACGDESVQKALLFNEIVVYERSLDFDTARQKAEAYLNLYPTDEAAQREYTFLTRNG